MFGKEIIELPVISFGCAEKHYIRKSSIIKIWADSNNATAIMYSSGAIDHIKLSLKETLKRIK